MLIDTTTGDVGWTSSSCDNEPKTPGFGISEDGDEGILHLTWGEWRFYTYWVEGDIYGPRLFAIGSGSGETTPQGCADVLLVPRCVDESSLVQSPVGTRCYLGGLPA